MKEQTSGYLLLTDLKNRGLEDILICCIDGLKGFPEAINTIFPKTEIQVCIVLPNRLNINTFSNPFDTPTLDAQKSSLSSLLKYYS